MCAYSIWLALGSVMLSKPNMLWGVVGVVIGALLFIGYNPSLWVQYPVLPYVRRTGCVPAEPRIAAGPDIVVYIPSPAPWRERRSQVMRKMRGELGGAHVWFIIGTLTGDRLDRPASGLAAVRREAALEPNPDVRYHFAPCRDFGDEYDNANGTSSTTCKTYEALKFIARTYADRPPRFVWRGADDAYLDLRVFRAHVAPRLQTCRLFFGRIRFPTPRGYDDLNLFPHQPNLYALFGLLKFGKYMHGMGFCLSWDVVQFLGNAPIPPRQTWCEDVMLGQWLLFYDVDFVDFLSVNPEVGMVNGDERLTYYPRLLLGHRLSGAQWAALERRPPDDTSMEFLS